MCPMASPCGGEPTPSLDEESLKLDSVNTYNGPKNRLQAMHGSGDNYYGALFTQMSYGMGENSLPHPPPAPPPQQHSGQANPMTLNFATAVALAAAVAAANNNGNAEGPPQPPASMMGPIPPSEVDKIALMAALLSGGGAGGTDFSNRGTPTGYPQSPPTSDYASANAAMYYSRTPNYYPQNTPNWSYHPQQQQPTQSYESAASDRDWYAAVNQVEDMYMQQRQSSYDQFNRISSPYMMPTPMQAAPGTAPTAVGQDYSILSNGGTAAPGEAVAAADLLGKFGCLNLQDSLPSQAQQQYMYNPQANDMLLQNNQWNLPNNATAVSRDRNFIDHLPQNHLSKLSADMVASMHNNNESQFPPHSRSSGRSSKTWAKIAGQPTGLDGPHSWSSGGGIKRLPSYPPPNPHLLQTGDSCEGSNFSSNGARQHCNFLPPPNSKEYADRLATNPELTDIVSEESRRESETLYQQLAKQINPPTFNTSLVKARFFVIKSFSEDDIHRSIKYSIWCSTDMGNKKLNAAYMEEANGGGAPIYLFYSVNGSGHFCGMAEMTSPVDCSTRAGVWAQDKWQGQFSVKWIFVKDVPNVALRHIHIETNDNKPVTHSRDTTEVPLERGRQVMEIFTKYNHGTSIFDDFLYYEHREQQEANRKETSSRRR